MNKTKENKCILFNKNYANRTKSVILYTEDFDKNGSLIFNVEYETLYSNGEGQHGNAMVDFNELLKAYHINSFEELINDFKSRYENDEKSWTKIIKEMKAKGLDVNDDEDESMNY